MAIKYYDGTKILSMKDLNGKEPEIYIVTANNCAGKTTFFNRYVVNRFKKYGEKFMLLYRFEYELDNVHEKFFGEIQQLFFKNDEMSSKKRMEGKFRELFLNDIPCGYAISLNAADQIKKNSHLFNDTVRMIFDEFQSQTNHYCPNEILKFRTVHVAVARGQGKQQKYLPVIMIGNNITTLNPYYTVFGITQRLQPDTKFLRGNGYVLEQGYNESAAKAQAESGFNAAFGDDQMNSFIRGQGYLSDSNTFIEKMNGENNYLATIKYKGKEYAIREYQDKGIVYCATNVDKTFKFKIALTTEDHNINFVMLKRNELFLQSLRWFFEHGCFRFENLQCKEVIINLLSYK